MINLGHSFYLEALFVEGMGAFLTADQGSALGAYKAPSCVDVILKTKAQAC
jgi:hypothetical protein